MKTAWESILVDQGKIKMLLVWLKTSFVIGKRVVDHKQDEFKIFDDLPSFQQRKNIQQRINLNARIMTLVKSFTKKFPGDFLFFSDRKNNYVNN